MVGAYLELGLVGLVWPFCGVLCRVFSRVYGVAGRVFGGQGCLRRDARGSGEAPPGGHAGFHHPRAQG